MVMKTSVLLKIFITVLVGMPFSLPQIASAQQSQSVQRGPSGLPLPRFVSLKSSQVNMRVGPGKQYSVAWRYTKSGLPFEIIQEYDNWRRVRDADGTMGWVHGSLLSGERTGIALPWRRQEQQPMRATLYKSPEINAKPIAFLEPGVIGKIHTCDGSWCEFEVTHEEKTFKGFATQAELWGAYPNEIID